ncbi:hypothetical protein F7Q96_02775, partial [Cupriavidus gilardii]
RYGRCRTRRAPPPCPPPRRAPRPYCRPPPRWCQAPPRPAAPLWRAPVPASRSTPPARRPQPRHRSPRPRRPPIPTPSPAATDLRKLIRGNGSTPSTPAAARSRAALSPLSRTNRHAAAMQPMATPLA